MYESSKVQLVLIIGAALTIGALGVALAWYRAALIVWSLQ